MKNYTTDLVKVCHFADHLTGQADGIFTHILSVVKFTDQEKFKHYLCYQGGEIINQKFHNVGGISFVLPNFNKKIPLRAIIDFIRICKKEEFSIIHAHFLKPYVIGAFLKLFFNYRVIYNYHGSFIINEFNTPVQQIIYKAAHWLICKLKLIDLAITPSGSSRNILLAETKTFPQIEVYYNTAFKSEYSDNPNQPVIEKLEVLKNEKILLGVIARQLPEKRIDIALEILKQLKDIYPNIHFVFCGDGYLLEEMKNYATKIEVNNHTTFLGYVEDIESIMKYLRLVLLTSDHEGFPLIIWEAMSCGVPIVSTDVGGIREIVEKESCGLLFEKGNVHEGVKKVIELLSDSNLCVQLGQNGRKAIINKYNPLQFGKRIEELYYSLL